MGLYTGVVIPLTLVTNRWAGEKFDQSIAVRTLLMIAALSFITMCLALSQVSSLPVFLAVTIPLMSLTNMGSGIGFAYGRVRAEQLQLDTTAMNSWLRISVSLGWMIGPALSYSVIAVSGFTAAFLIAALLGAVWLFVMLLSIPNGFRAPSKTRKQNTGGPVNWGLLLAGGTCVLFTATNSLFVSAMPLYFVTEVALPEFTPGLSLSIKCAVEIGAIFVSAFLAERFGFKPVLLASAALGIAGMLLFSIASSIWHVAAISALEGLYYGLFAGVAITYVQSFAPNRLGRATATYMNSLFLGGMIGSVSMGFIASSFDFRAVLFVAAACSATALCAVALGGRRHAQN